MYGITDLLENSVLLPCSMFDILYSQFCFELISVQQGTMMFYGWDRKCIRTENCRLAEVFFSLQVLACNVLLPTFSLKHWQGGIVTSLVHFRYLVWRPKVSVFRKSRSAFSEIFLFLFEVFENLKVLFSQTK